MSKIKTLCRKPGCRNYTDSPSHYCAAHADLAAITQRRPHKTAAPAYNNTAWRTLRDYKLTLTPLCERCTSAGRITAASTVHHIDQNPNNNDIANLQSLCRDCHEIIHNRQREKVIDFLDKISTGKGGSKVPKSPKNTVTPAF